jgi:hypothetical protein
MTKKIVAVLFTLVSTTALAAPPAQHVIIEPQPAIAENVIVVYAVSTLLFGGVTPANGFSVQGASAICAVNDGAPASLSQPIGFLTSPNAIYTTPLGYKPVGPVSVACEIPDQPGAGPIVVNARAW